MDGVSECYKCKGSGEQRFHMTRLIVALDLTPEEMNHLGLMQSEGGDQTPTDELITSIIRSVIYDDLEEEKKRAQ